METSPEETQPSIYWDDSDAARIAADLEWLARCRQRLLHRVPALQLSEAAARSLERGSDASLLIRPER